MPRKPKIPRTVKVGPHTYTILLRAKSQMPDGEETAGHCDPSSLQISIQARMKRSKTQEILFHELGHACTYPELWDTTATDEVFVTATAPRMLQVIQDNPSLVEYLQKT